MEWLDWMQTAVGASAPLPAFYVKHQKGHAIVTIEQSIGDITQEHMTMEPEEPVVTILRVYRYSGEVIALFPYIPHDAMADYCVCYTHIGQHYYADYQGVINDTIAPRYPEDHKRTEDLKQELADIGYNLKYRRRIKGHDDMMKRRKAYLEEMRKAREEHDLQG